ncbi:MAG: hypothetical protein SPL12_09190 [Bacteroidales bacterium]|nr:hypothetical protein [Bacteroidales bacterium]
MNTYRIVKGAVDIVNGIVELDVEKIAKGGFKVLTGLISSQLPGSGDGDDVDELADD